MAYTTATRVRKLIPVVTASAYSDADMDDLIADHDAELDVALSFHGYVVPVTDPPALLNDRSSRRAGGGRRRGRGRG